MSSSTFQIVIWPDGSLRLLYTEVFDLVALGTQQIRRASHVEPDVTGRWFVDLSPVVGPILGPFIRRTEALAAEQAWLEIYRLASG